MRLTRPFTILGITLAVLSLVAGCSKVSPSTTESPSGDIAACPVVLKAEDPAIETTIGRIEITRVDVWLAPKCLAAPFGETATNTEYLVTYTWTNTTDATVSLGHSSTPLIPILIADGDSTSFIPPVELQSIEPYQDVAPGQTVTIEKWHTATEEPGAIPDAIEIYSNETNTVYGTTALKG